MADSQHDYSKDAPVRHDPENDLELITVTKLWRFAKMLYNIGDRPLAIPVSLRMLGYAAAIYIPSVLIFSILGVGWLSSSAMFFRIFVPGLVVWLALRYVSSGGKATELLRSWVGYSVLVVRNFFTSSSTHRGINLSTGVRVSSTS